MKVENFTIQRVCVRLSCGCCVLADYKDRLCKEPFVPDLLGNGDEDKAPGAAKAYDICKKHAKDPQRSMLEFMMAERLEEAIETAQHQAAPPRMPSATPASLDGTEGAKVERVAMVGGKNRPKRPPAIKHLNRTPPQVVEDDPSTGVEMDDMLRDGDVELGRAGDTSSLDSLISSDKAPVPSVSIPSLNEVLDVTDPDEDKGAQRFAAD